MEFGVWGLGFGVGCTVAGLGGGRIFERGVGAAPIEF